MSDFTPNPMYSFGRVDTSAGEGGESLHKVNPALFGVSESGGIGRGSEVDGEAAPADVALANSPLGNVPENLESPAVDPTFAVAGGTADTGHSGDQPAEQAEEAPTEQVAADEQVEEAPDQVEEQAAPVGYADLNKPDVIAIARERGIDDSGTKAEIIARLEADDAAV